MTMRKLLRSSLQILDTVAEQLNGGFLTKGSLLLEESNLTAPRLGL